MNIYRFASSCYETVSAFTWDATGGNLPADYAPWRPLNGGRGLCLDALAARVAELVNRDGYFLLSGRNGYSRAKRGSNQTPPATPDYPPNLADPPPASPTAHRHPTPVS
jgi:hypothetical protein